MFKKDSQIMRVPLSGLPFLAGVNPPFSADSNTLGTHSSMYMPSGLDVFVRVHCMYTHSTFGLHTMVYCSIASSAATGNS